MKWIGQHIWSFISRFRNDVYLEAVDTSTETDMLVVDSAGKVTKRAIDAITVDVSDFMTNGVDNRVLTATGADAMNAEANFTFDGSLATITGSTKMISDSPLLMHTDGNADDYHQLTVGVNGSIEWASVDAAAANAHLDFNIDGLFKVDSTNLSLTDSTMTLNPTGLLKTTATGVEIENASDSGVAALLIDNNDEDEMALQVSPVNTTMSVIGVTCIPLTAGRMLALQHVSIHTTGYSGDLSAIEYTNAGVLASGQTQNIVGHDIHMNDLATNHASSTKTMTGIDLDVTYSSAQGTTSATGINLVTTGADLNTGIDMTTTDGGTDIVLRSSADTSDLCFITTTTHGATTIATVDNDAAAAHFEIAADGNIDLDAAGDIILDSHTGTAASGGIKIKAAGTEIMNINAHHGGTFLQMYENGGASTDDFFTIDVAEHGDTTLTTVDSAAANADFRVVADGDIILDAAGTGIISMGGAGVQICKLSSAGLSFVDNTGAGIIFEGDTDDAYNTTLKAADTTSSSKTITLPDATGTVQLQGSNTGQTFSVPLKVDDLYVLYVGTQNYWYHTAYAGQSLGTSIGTESDHVAMRAVSYVAPAACKVNKVTIAFYSTGSADLEFQVTKIPLVDNSNSNVTLAAMTHNDINFSMVANYNYVKTMTMTGDSNDNALSAGQAFTLAIRRTDATGTRVLYGNCFAEIELT